MYFKGNDRLMTMQHSNIFKHHKRNKKTEMLCSTFCLYLVFFNGHYIINSSFDVHCYSGYVIVNNYVKLSNAAIWYMFYYQPIIVNEHTYANVLSLRIPHYNAFN